MRPRNMPKAEVSITAADVAGLIADQYPPLAGALVTAGDFGWDNLMFRVGDSHVARLPRRAVSAPMVESEARWLPVLAPRLSLPVPSPVFHGEPGRGFPWTWTIARWIDGESAATSSPIDEAECAVQLGGFLAELHQPAPSDAPQNPFRGGPLDQKRETTMELLHPIDGLVGSSALQDIWSEACDSAPYHGPPLWLHGDMHPNNLIVRDRKLAGVIDFTDLTFGDPACDLMAGWTTFGADARELLFEAYGGINTSLRIRARGWAVHHGAACLARGGDNEVMSQIGRRTLRRVTSD